MIFYFLICFLLGSIPTAHLVAKTKGIDIKKVGSGNSGATNVLRSVGAKEGFLVMLVDILKGFLSVYISKYFFLENNYFSVFQVSALGGFVSILGHIFSPFLKFKGGKGVATSIGIYLHLIPISCFASILLALLIIFIKKKASIGTLLGLVALPFFCFLLERNHPEFGFLIKLVLFTILLVLYTHRDNLKRIINGEELSIKK